MIQILGIRSFVGKEGKSVTYDKLFDTGIDVETTQELFEKSAEIIEKIEPGQRWNLYYTVANCGVEKREFKSTRTVAFDLDGIEHGRNDEYTQAVCAVLKVASSDLGIVSSGNGLHFLVHLEQTITDAKFFKENKVHYNDVCNQIDKALDKAGLPGKADQVIFDARRIMRLPGSVNRKPDKPEKNCVLLQKIGRALTFSLAALSTAPVVTAADQLDKGLLKRYPTTDPTAVLTGCSFLKHCHESPDSLSEPTWYAALSITARLDGQGSTGRERSHEISRGHGGYSSEATDEKIDQAILASGPRTCESINALWGKCSTCPYFGKVTSPILIRGADTLATESTGFHTVPWDGKGKPSPNHEDLIAYFKRERGFKVLGDSRQVYTWEKTHYREIQKPSLEAFARQHFDPKPRMDTAREFRQRVEISEIVPVEWWEHSVGRKMNFLNGYLDIDSMDFRPHDPELAFRTVLPYEYDADAKAPTFEKMLRLVTGKDDEMIQVLLEFMGYCLSNDTCWAQKALVLTGEGSNGKSTFLEALKALAGKGNYASNNLGKIDADYNLATLDKKLFNISEETSPKALADNSTFKNLVTGGTFLVRLPYKEPYEIANRAKQILTCNTLPDTLDNSHGFYRRLLVVPFEQRIEADSEDYDPRMTEKLEKELAGIFNLAIAAYHRLVARRRFTDSAKLKESLEEYRLENDSVLYWVKEHLKVHTNGGFEHHFTPSGDLYAAYRDAMKAMSRIPVHEQKFCKQLAKLRGEIWGDHPYKERVIRKTIDVQGRKVKVRGIQGVEVEPLN